MHLLQISQEFSSADMACLQLAAGKGRNQDQCSIRTDVELSMLSGEMTRSNASHLALWRKGQHAKLSHPSRRWAEGAEEACDCLLPCAARAGAWCLLGFPAASATGTVFDADQSPGGGLPCQKARPGPSPG